MANTQKQKLVNEDGVTVYPLTDASQVIIDKNGTRLGDGNGGLNLGGNFIDINAREMAEEAKTIASNAMQKANFSFDASTGTLNITL